MRRLFTTYGLVKSFTYAWKGVVWLWNSEPNFRLHILIGGVAIFLGLLFRLSLLEWCIISMCITSVMAAEAFNTSLEKLADALHPEYHDLIRKSKDISAGAVLLIALAAFAVGLIIFLPKLWNLIQLILNHPNG